MRNEDPLAVVAQLLHELDDTKRKLAEAHQMASIGRLLAGVVHEINSPIASIFSNNEVTLRSLETLKRLLADARESSAAPPEKAMRIVDTVMSLAAVDKIACERISSVIRGLKTFARVEEGDLRQVDLHQVLTNTLKLTACVFRKRIQVETDFAELPQVECYPHLLNQVFLNLVVNAGQAIEGEGKITVRTRQEGDCVHISVTDTGKGIRPEDQAKIFAAGFTTKAPGDGTGLGLTLARDIIVDAHGGRMTFESQPGAGTTFHVLIPIQHRKDQHPKE